MDVGDFDRVADVSDDDFDSRRIHYLVSQRENNYPEGLMLFARKQGTPFVNAKDQYVSVDEMAEEFRKDYGEYLPADFDWKAHLVWFEGARTYWRIKGMTP